MKVLKKSPRQPWKEIEIENTLEALQAEVGGYIEVVPFTSDTAVICNEEGRLRRMEPCGFFSFVGPVLIAGVQGEEFTDVPEPAYELFGVLR